MSAKLHFQLQDIVSLISQSLFMLKCIEIKSFSTDFASRLTHRQVLTVPKLLQKKLKSIKKMYQYYQN